MQGLLIEVWEYAQLLKCTILKTCTGNSLVLTNLVSGFGYLQIPWTSFKYKGKGVRIFFYLMQQNRCVARVVGSFLSHLQPFPGPPRLLHFSKLVPECSAMSSLPGHTAF